VIVPEPSPVPAQEIRHEVLICTALQLYYLYSWHP
jgi:hypothetical protein